MARNRFGNLEPERREAILAAAGEEFAERGYGAASLSRIIERAGISKGSLYYYFEDKADLFDTAIQVAVERWLKSAGGVRLAALTRETYWGGVRAAVERSLSLRTEDAWHVRLVEAFPRLRDDAIAAEAVEPILEWGQSDTRRLLARGQELGTVRRDLPLDLLVAMALGASDAADRWMIQAAEAYSEEEMGALFTARMALFRDMLEARDATAERSAGSESP